MSDILGMYHISVPNYGELFYEEGAPYAHRPLTDEEKANHPHPEWNPQYTSFRICDVPVVKTVIALLDKYGVKYNSFVDSVPGTFDLNQEYLETKPLMLDVQYSGALPRDWSEADREILRVLNYTGKIVTQVTWIIDRGDGTQAYEPNSSFGFGYEHYQCDCGRIAKEFEKGEPKLKQYENGKWFMGQIDALGNIHSFPMGDITNCPWCGKLLPKVAPRKKVNAKKKKRVA